MKTIIIKNIILVNFKGMRYLEINFDPKRTIIKGANGSGKTTVFDAFTWCLFGKNSEDRKVFNIKTLGPDGEAIPKLPHEVTVTLDVNGEEVTLQRRFIEKWVKKRGSSAETFQGHEEERLYNEVPMSVKEWDEKIAAICSEQVFKFITNPNYFCAQQADVQREMIFKMAGGIDDQDVAAGNQDFAALLDELTGKTLEEYKREVRAKKARIKEEMDGIPARIEERSRDLQDNINREAVEAALAQIDARLEQISQAMADNAKRYTSAAEAAKQKSQQISAKIQERGAIEQRILSEALKEYNELAQRQAELRREYDAAKQAEAAEEQHLNEVCDLVKTKQEEMERLRNEWRTIYAEELSFDDKDFVCPTCHRPLETEDVEAKQAEMREAFNTRKAKALESNKATGMATKESLTRAEAEAAAAAAKIEELAEQAAKIAANQIYSMHLTRPDVQAKVSANEDYIARTKEIEQLQAELSQETSAPEDGELKEQQRLLQAERDEQKRKLTLQDRNDANQTRIKELEDQLKRLNVEYTALEGKEDLMTRFGRAKAELVEARVNALFDRVKFRLFKAQINGELVETCEAMIDGVPYSDKNKADKVNAGLDIINALCRYDGVTAPIFVDNSESINEVKETASQVILLRVTEDRDLKVEY